MRQRGEKDTAPMDENPTPQKAASKRRGLALPPRGQALTRLQDLEAENPVGPDPAPEAATRRDVSNAVNTASSNAVSQGGSTADVPAAPPPEVAPVLAAPAAYRAPARAAREPTTRITVDMPDSLHRRVSLLSVEERRSIKDLVIEALERTYFQPEGEGR